MDIDWKIVVEATPPSKSLLTQLTPLLSTLVGALIAGTTGYALQGRQFQRQQAILDADRRDKEETIALGTLMKINRTLTTIVRVRDLIDEGSKLTDKPDKLDRWAKTYAFSTDLPRFEVTIDELVFVKQLGDVAAMGLMMDLTEINNSYADNMKTYGELRKSLGERLTAMSVVATEGDTVSSEFTDDQLGQLKPEMAKLNKLLVDVRSMAADHEPLVKKLFAAVQAGAVAKLGKRAIQFDLSAPIGKAAEAVGT